MPADAPRPVSGIWFRTSFAVLCRTCTCLNSLHFVCNKQKNKSARIKLIFSLATPAISFLRQAPKCRRFQKIDSTPTSSKKQAPSFFSALMAIMPSAQRHPTEYQTYAERSEHLNLTPLATYLLRLIQLKRTNLCVSADVSTTAELLQLAEDVGDQICVLKTHADIVKDFTDRTARGLREVARRKKFIIFEDRKLGDIGSTRKALSPFIAAC